MIANIENKFATRVESAQAAFFFTWVGVLELDPSGDEWFETETAPAVIINQEGNFDAIEAANRNAIGTVWNAWQTDWIGVDVATTITQTTRTERSGNAPRTLDIASNRGFGRPSQSFTRWITVGAREIQVEVTNQETTTTTNQSRTGLATRVVERIDSESLGDRVVERNDIPFMRSRNIEFVVRNAKPRTQVYPFFDGIDVNAHMTPTSSTYGIGAGTAKGTGLRSDNLGTVSATFTIPATDELSFTTGSKALKITDSSTNTAGSGSQGEAIYEASGQIQVVQEEIKVES